jgi:hypothetical protein
MQLVVGLLLSRNVNCNMSAYWRKRIALGIHFFTRLCDTFSARSVSPSCSRIHERRLTLQEDLEVELDRADGVSASN